MCERRMYAAASACVWLRSNERPLLCLTHARARLGMFQNLQPAKMVRMTADTHGALGDTARDVHVDAAAGGQATAGVY